MGFDTGSLLEEHRNKAIIRPARDRRTINTEKEMRVKIKNLGRTGLKVSEICLAELYDTRKEAEF